MQERKNRKRRQKRQINRKKNRDQKRKEEKTMKITLKDGTVKEYESKMSVLDIAKDISEGLARAATSAR